MTMCSPCAGFGSAGAASERQPAATIKRNEKKRGKAVGVIMSKTKGIGVVAGESIAARVPR
jgi:hypothetical protein